MKKNQGKAFLVEGILRESEFYGGIIDPNRIFSSLGAKANIQKYNPDFTQAQVQRLLTIDKDRKIFFKKIFPKNIKIELLFIIIIKDIILIKN